MRLPEANGNLSVPNEIGAQERVLTIEGLRRSAVSITSSVTVKAHIVKEAVHQGGKKELTKTQLDALKIEIDNAVADYEEEQLDAAPYSSDVICEGEKEGAKYGPQAAVRVIRGRHGPAHLKVDDENFDVAVVIDPVEGTRPTAANEVGGTSFFVGSKGGKAREIPKEDDARYFNRIAGPARLRGYISVANSPAQNLGAVCGAYGVSADKVTVVVLDRPRNQALIDELTSLGVIFRRIGPDANLIKECDFMPAFLALYSDKPMLSYGAGGKEEGWAAAMLAKKFGAAFDGQLVDVDGNSLENFPEILTPEDIVTGDKDNIFASVSSITGDNWFGMGPITTRIEPNGQITHYVETISVGSGGLQREIIPVQPTI